MLLSNFAHRRQQRESDCLVACADMVLNHLGISLGYQRLAKLLRAGPSFTPFSNLRYLESLRLSVTIRKHGDLSIFTPTIELGFVFFASVIFPLHVVLRSTTPVVHAILSCRGGDISWITKKLRRF